QHQAPGHEPAAEHPIELADARVQTLVARRLDLVQPHRLARRALRGLGGAAAAAALLPGRGPLPAPGTLPPPAGGRGAAGRTDEDGAGAGHGPKTVGPAPDVLSPYVPCG